jgi:hypothetical protein
MDNNCGTRIKIWEELLSYDKRRNNLIIKWKGSYFHGMALIKKEN